MCHLYQALVTVIVFSLPRGCRVRIGGGTTRVFFNILNTSIEFCELRLYL